MNFDGKFYIKISLVVYFIWLLVFEVIGWYASMLPEQDFTTYMDKQIPL